MAPFRALLSALTFFGGHIINRRLDRVVLVFAALAIIGIVSYVLLPNLIFNALGTDLITLAIRVPAILILATAIGSGLLTWKDAKAPTATALSMSSRLAGAVISLFGLMILSFSVTSLFTAGAHKSSPSANSHQARPAGSIISESMYTSVYFGGGGGSDLKAPPGGPQPLRGRIIMDGRPIEDAEIELVLNGTYRSSTLFTDRNGGFELQLPAGKWFINQAAVTGWDDAPAGRELLLFSEHEPLQGAGRYSRYQTANDTGLEITLPAAANSPIPTFELRDAIDMQWPLRASEMTAADTAAADISSSVISWKAVPSATEYEVQLNSMQREGQTTHYNLLLRRRQSGLSLRLADLPQRPRDSADPSEYSVTVFAFDCTGKLLSQSRDGALQYAFTLTGEAQLGKESYPVRLNEGSADCTTRP